MCLHLFYDTDIGDGFASKCPNQQQGGYICSRAALHVCNSYGTLRTQVHGSGSWAAIVTAHAHKSLDVILYLRRKGMHTHPQNRSKSQRHTTDASLRHLQIDKTEGDHRDNINFKQANLHADRLHQLLSGPRFRHPPRCHCWIPPTWSSRWRSRRHVIESPLGD